MASDPRQSAEERAAADEQQQSPAVLTGHTTQASVTEDEVSGKVQALHTTEVITDPDDELAVQGHDDPRVDGRLADPLRREPSPNEIADGEGEADVTVSTPDTSGDEPREPNVERRDDDVY